MNRQCQLSINTKNYLARFYCILDEMIQGMTGACLTDSISGNFIAQMIPHHMAAIEMSKNLLQYTTNVPLQEIARGIIEEQTKSIENMLRIRQCCQKQTDCPQAVCRYQNTVDQILKTMFSRMNNAPATNNIDCNFMREMIPHHKGAIRMSRSALEYDICGELAPILEAIIASQEKGVRQMECLEKKLSCGC